MRRYVGIIFGVVALLTATGIMYSRVSERQQVAEREASFAQLRADFLERVGWLRSNPDPKAYLDEVNPALRAYFAAVDAHVARFGGNPEFDDFLVRLEKRAGQKGGDAKAAYDYVRKSFDHLRAGKHAPTFTATDKGMRLDVTTEDTMVAGEPHVRYRVLLWGAQREPKEDKGLKKIVTSASFTVDWKFTDARGKLVAEMNAQDPSMKVGWPEQFIAEFPPQLVLGHYDVGLLPSEVKTAEITFNVTSRAQTGGEAKARYVWKLQVPPSWKLQAGQAWAGAVETTREPEEIGALGE